MFQRRFSIGVWIEVFGIDRTDAGMIIPSNGTYHHIIIGSFGLTHLASGKSVHKIPPSEVQLDLDR